MPATARLDASLIALAARSAKHHLAIGELTTCQFGNPFDTDWNPQTHTHQQVEILDIQSGLADQILFLVKKVGKGYIGVATVSHSENIKGALYCTRAVDYESGDWPGISSEAGARAQLGW